MTLGRFYRRVYTCIYSMYKLRQTVNMVAHVMYNCMHRQAAVLDHMLVPVGENDGCCFTTVGKMTIVCRQIFTRTPDSVRIPEPRSAALLHAAEILM